MTSRPLLLFLLLSTFVMHGCATFKGRTTYVKVVSHPPGAEVWVDGRHNVGQTPLFAPISRQRKHHLEVRLRASAMNVPLTPAYRWQESFFANLGWISPIIWPVGWATDLFSGAAWDFEAIPPLVLPNADRRKDVSLPIKTVAIAPPLSDFDVLSEEVAFEIESVLRRRLPHASVLSYDSTAKTFEAYNYTTRGASDPRLDDELSHDLGTTHLAISTIREDKEKIQAEIQLKDVFLNTTVGEMQIEIPNKHLTAMNATGWRELVLRSVSLIPNALSVQLIANGNSGVSANDSLSRPYSSNTEHSSTLFDYVSRISARNVPHPKGMKGFKGRFRFVPDFGYSQNKFRLFEPSVTDSRGAWIGSYKFESLYAGFGPELGLETPAGYLYLQLVPVYAWNHFISSAPAQTASLSETGLAVSTELGFLFWLTDSLNMRLYVQSRTTREESWTNIFRKSGINDITASNASHVVSGFAIGYYFPEVRRALRRQLL